MDSRRRADLGERVKSLTGFCDLRGKTVLEVGSDWHGIVAQLLLDAGAAKVVTTNFTPQWPDGTSWMEGRVERRRVDARSLEDAFPAESFDVIVGFALLEHLCGIPQFLDSASTAMRPGGILFVHGGPIWTSQKGHHVFVDGTERSYRFSDASNPIPDWHHLVNDRTSLAARLTHEAVPIPDAEKIVHYVYESDVLNRIGYRAMRELFSKSGLKELAVLETTSPQPDAKTAERIEAGPYAGEERYNVCGLTFVASA